MEFDILGEPPTPEGTWVHEAAYVSAAALRRGLDPHELAARVPGARVLPGGLIRIVVEVPGELLNGAFEHIEDQGWPDLPRTWDNPGFVVRYAAARAANAQRWARDLGVPSEPFVPRLLDGPWDRGVLRVLAELPGRRASRDPGWPAYLVRLATAYHDAHENAPAHPKGDEEPSELHTARMWLAQAVQKVLPATKQV
ncbi:anticodon-binding protein [Nonomuraea sp. NPDC050663]|uniref:anticodon-binding protein n=1 Tax=Nonomuraea sp. NPDC050663 TaxID=3364370 RepID=UPI003789DC6A